MRRLSWRPVLLGPTVGFVGWVLGLRPADAVLVGLVTFVIALVTTAVATGANDEWPAEQVDESDGSRREISALTWSFVGRDGRVAEPAVRRLRLVAAGRLARVGVVIPGGITHRPRAADGTGPEPDGHPPADGPRERARELLGDRAWATLTGPGGWLPSLTELAHCITAIEDLAPDRPAARGPGRGRRRTPRLDRSAGHRPVPGPAGPSQPSERRPL